MCAALRMALADGCCIIAVFVTLFLATGAGCCLCWAECCCVAGNVLRLRRRWVVPHCGTWYALPKFGGRGHLARPVHYQPLSLPTVTILWPQSLGNGGVSQGAHEARGAYEPRRQRRRLPSRWKWLPLAHPNLSARRPILRHIHSSLSYFKLLQATSTNCPPAPTRRLSASKVDKAPLAATTACPAQEYYLLRRP